jgi:hypothetical protein
MSALDGSGSFAPRSEDRAADRADRPSRGLAGRLTAALSPGAGALALALYVAGALVMQRHAVAHLNSVVSGNGVGDPTQFMWSMWWWPHAFVHWTDPFFTHEIWVNDHYNLASVTSVPGPALLLSPVTALWGPLVSYNVANLLAPVLSAYCGYRLCRYLTHQPAAAILGGWLFGFCIFGLGQLAGHLQLVFTFGPPLLIELSLRRMDRNIGRVRYVICAAVVLAATISCGTEVAFTMTCMGVVLVLCGLLLGGAQSRRRTLALGPEIIAFYLLAAIVCSPYIYYALKGPEVGVGQGIIYPGDLLSYVVPTRIAWLGGSWFASTSAHFIAGTTEEDTYLGLPLIAIILASTVEAWRRPRTRVLIAVIVVAFIWSLGSVLNVDGHSSVKLPFSVIAGDKGFNEILPARIGLYTELGGAVAAALWLSRPNVRRRWLRWALALLAAAFLFPNANATESTGSPIFQETYANLAFFTHGDYEHYLYPNEVVLPLPFGLDGPSLLWQAQAKGYFRLASGWFGYWPPDYYNDPVVMQLIGLKPFNNPNSVTAMRSFLLAHGVGAVVVQDGQAGPWPAVFTQLGLKPISVGGVDLYRIPVNKAGGAVLN